MKIAIVVAIILFAIMGITEVHRSVYTNDCHYRGGVVSTKLYFFNQCWATVDDENPPYQQKDVRIK